jgi:hypothetical protein
MFGGLAHSIMLRSSHLILYLFADVSRHIINGIELGIAICYRDEGSGEG